MPEAQANNPQILQLLLLVNRLQLKAFNAPNQEALGFIIVNDTHQIFRYNRAFLWSFDDSRPKIIALSGQHKVNKETEFYQKANRLVSFLKTPEEPQQLSPESFNEEKQIWNELFPQQDQTAYWVPVKVGDKLRLGLWLEIAVPQNSKERNPTEELNFIYNTLAPGYASAWAKFDTTKLLKPIIRSKKFLYAAALILATLLFAVRLPLRVVAPAEVVPEKPIVISAPLEGIIEHVVVKPGQSVNNGTRLFEYDKRLPLQELKTAQQQVEIAEAEYDRASTLGISDPKALAEVELLRLKLEREQIGLELAQIQADKLDVNAPAAGVVMIDYPEEWSGKPVRVGEKVMTLSDPNKTKLRMWVPESDNVVIDPEKLIHIILNVTPDRQLYAKLDYISFESRIGEGEVPAFVAEAQWDSPPDDVKLGLKGTAVLYGERVSLFYFIFRKPWASLRRLTGI